MRTKKKRKSRKNIYTHEIDLLPLRIKNREKEGFRKRLEKIEYRGYEVEQISDGRKIVITKPGGKFVYGGIKRDDLMVWIYDAQEHSLWLISHRNILEDLEDKGRKAPSATVRIINALERVFKGEDPDDIFKKKKFENPCGETPEVLLKAYKWIWGQEDCNYPPPLRGRDMSMDGIRLLRKKLRNLK